VSGFDDADGAGGGWDAACDDPFEPVDDWDATVDPSPGLDEPGPFEPAGPDPSAADDLEPGSDPSAPGSVADGHLDRWADADPDEPIVVVDDPLLFEDLGAPGAGAIGPFLPADLDLWGGDVGAGEHVAPELLLPGPGAAPLDLREAGVEPDGPWADPSFLAGSGADGMATLDDVRVGGDGAAAEVVTRLWSSVVADRPLPRLDGGGLDVQAALSALDGHGGTDPGLAAVVAAARLLAS
jgi:hypothetical protein